MNKILGTLCLAALTVTGSAAFAADLTVSGSTTLLPIAQRAAESYMEAHPETAITVSGTGSGNGIKALLDGSINLATSSRFLKDAEVKKALEQNRYPVPFSVALDGLVPVVHPDNKVADLTLAQLKDIYTGKVTNWKELGGADAPIVAVGRDTSSGTYEVWESKVMKKERVTPKAMVVASNGAMLSTVADNPNAVGYLGLGYVNDQVKALKVEGKAASYEATRDGSYPIARALFFFTDGWPSGETKKFIDFVLSDDGQKLVKEAGYVPLR